MRETRDYMVHDALLISILLRDMWHEMWSGIVAAALYE